MTEVNNEIIIGSQPSLMMADYKNGAFRSILKEIFDYWTFI